MKKRILIVVYALLLCVTICFAWLSNSRVNYVKNINVDYKNGALTIGHAGVKGVIGRIDENGNFQMVEKLEIDPKVMVPGSGHKFQIRLKNTEEITEQKIKLGVLIRLSEGTKETRGVDGEQDSTLPDVFDKLYISVLKKAANGGGANNVEFDSENSFSVKLSAASVYGNKKDNMYFLWICGEGNEIILPATRTESSSDSNSDSGEELEEGSATQTTDSYDDYNVTINCSLEFDPSAAAQHQNIQIETLAFRVE